MTSRSVLAPVGSNPVWLLVWLLFMISDLIVVCSEYLRTFRQVQIGKPYSPETRPKANAPQGCLLSSLIPTGAAEAVFACGPSPKFDIAIRHRHDIQRPSLKHQTEKLLRSQAMYLPVRTPGSGTMQAKKWSS
ncbi:hypothetical protein K438DRAFT_1766417 [Mycena galopus ATCC 62051]|nr:hypothetical protein K438DRAFT_1766417 [Mycena galopus ATCC 62051]